MAHSPVAWEHVTFKDVVIKVSNVDVYYKAIRFYLQVWIRGCLSSQCTQHTAVGLSLALNAPNLVGLETAAANGAPSVMLPLCTRIQMAQILTCARCTLCHLQEHPELLADVMKAMEMRLDHARVVDMFRKEKSLPLIKDYLLNVQKTNILEVRRDVLLFEAAIHLLKVRAYPPCVRLLGLSLRHLLAVLWSCFLQVNEAVNDLLIDEEDFDGLKSSIASFDNFDQVRLRWGWHSHMDALRSTCAPFRDAACLLANTP